MVEIHNYERHFAAALERIRVAEISPCNKKLINEFVNDALLQNKSKSRVMRYIDVVLRLALDTKQDLDHLSEGDLKRYIGQIQQRSDFSPWTKQTYKVVIRQFYKWIYKSAEYPELVRWIKIGVRKCEAHLPSQGDLLTEDDVKKLIDVTRHPRDKALVAVLWESGARISEIGNALIQNVVFDKHGAVLVVRGKTGSRRVRLVWSVSYLATWLLCHPHRQIHDAPLWVNHGTRGHGKAMCYRTIRNLLRRWAKWAGLRKRIHPHLFRHSRATFMARHLTEFQMNQYFGWIQGSDMPSTYVHMSGRDVDNAVLAMNGLKIEEKANDAELRPRVCPRCETINSHEGQHCGKCGGPLDVMAALAAEKRENELHDVMNRLLKDEDVQRLIAEKVKQLRVPDSPS